MNKQIIELAYNPSLEVTHDLYKAIAKVAVANLSHEEFLECVAQDHRFAQLAYQPLTEAEKIELIDKNIETYYAFYEDASYHVLKHVVEKSDIPQNIYDTILRVLSTPRMYNPKEALGFVLDHAHILNFKSSFYFNSFFENLTEDYTDEELDILNNRGLIIDISFTDDNGNPIKTEKMDTISRSVYNRLKKNIDWFYDLYYDLAKRDFTTHLTWVEIVPSNELLSYRKIKDLIEKLIADESVPRSFITELVEYAIQRGWHRRLFNDVSSLDMMEYWFVFYRSALKLKSIYSDFNFLSDDQRQEVAKKIFEGHKRSKETTGYNDVKAFISFPQFVIMSLDAQWGKK